MEVNRLTSLCIEIYKSINNITPMYMNEIFKLRETSRGFLVTINSIYMCQLLIKLVLVIRVLDTTGLKFGIRSFFI